MQFKNRRSLTIA